jgi:hypothetical protein
MEQMNLRIVSARLLPYGSGEKNQDKGCQKQDQDGGIALDRGISRW